MLYSPKANAVVYDLADPTRVLAVIPESRRLPNGQTAVPFNLRNMQIMRKLDHDALSPIEFEYDWPSKYPHPRPNQLVTAAFKSLYPRNIDTSEMRLGKTLASLWAADYLMSKGVINKCLILSPLSTLERVWNNEISTNFHNRRTCTVLYGDKDKRLKRLRDKHDFYIINFDGLGIGYKRKGHSLILGPLAQALIDDEKINLVIVDEASAYKHASSIRYKIIQRVFEMKPYMWRWALTGTPAATAPTDAWALGRLIYGKEGRPESYETFRNRTMSRVSEFKWRPIPGADRVVAEWLQPSVRFTRKELGFPPLSYETRDVPMSPMQKQAYDAMKKDLEIVTATGQKIDAVNEAALRTKLIQIACGAVYGPEHEVHKIDAKPRLDELTDIIEEAGGKILIFAPLTSVINLIHSHISKTVFKPTDGVSRCERVNGEVSSAKRNKIFTDFQDGNVLRVIVADPRTMAHGLNLTAASTIVWYGPTDSLELYEQANARIDGPGAAGVVIHLSSTPVEREIYRRQQEKQALQGSILALLRAG